MRTLSTFTCAILVAASTACVSAGKYDAAAADAERARVQLRAAETRHASTAADLDRSRSETFGCQKQLDDATAMNQQLQTELARLGKDAEQLLSATGVLASSLQQARDRLEELRRAQAAADARAALFRDVALRLKRMVDAGELQIVLRSGRMVLILPTDVLFDSGKAKLKPGAKEALAQIGTVLGSIQGRRFQVAGHTDDEPIRVSGFASNWELSSQRALDVVSVLIQAGMRPQTLSAAGYGEFDGVVPNDSPENKAKNRRIEITLQPNINEFVAVPQPR